MPSGPLPIMTTQQPSNNWVLLNLLVYPLLLLVALTSHAGEATALTNGNRVCSELCAAANHPGDYATRSLLLGCLCDEFGEGEVEQEEVGDPTAINARRFLLQQQDGGVGDEKKRLSELGADFQRLLKRYLASKMMLLHEYAARGNNNPPPPPPPPPHQSLVWKRAETEARLQQQPSLFLLKKRYGDFDYGLELPWQAGQRRREGLTDDQQKKVFRYGK